MKNIHASLVRKYPWYQKWHDFKGHTVIHWAVFCLTMLLLSVIFLNVQAGSTNRTVTTAPTISIISPSDNEIVPSGNVQLTYNTTGNPTSCWYDLGGDATFQLPNCLPATLNLDDNDYVINVYVQNSLGTDFTSVNFHVAENTDTVKPVVTSFTIPATSTSLTVPITTFTATDNTGVEGYKLTQSSNTPAFNAGGWSFTAPTNYVFTNPGTKTLYAWAKDASGNVSLSVVQQVVVGNTDTTPPTITITLPQTSTTLTTPITIVANDNVGVTGYKLSESSTIPTTSWLSTLPTSYTFANTGEKKLYAWARDAAGNISTASSATTMISYHFYYLSPTGNDINSCTFTNPCFSLNKVWPLLVAGDTVYMRGGNYGYSTVQKMENKSGTTNNMINILAYNNETPNITKVLPYNSGDTAALVYLNNVNYVYMRGVEISGNTQQDSSVWSGLKAENVNNSKFEKLNIHNNGGSGMVLTYNSSGNEIINSDFHENYDPISIHPYDNSDGLDVSTINGVGISGTNTVRGCRSWWNGDDGFDTWNNDGNVIFENNWSFWNGYKENHTTIGGNGNGYKLGPTVGDYSSEIKRTLKNNIAFENTELGFDQNNALTRIVSYNNISYHNGNYGFNFARLTPTYNLNHIIKNNISHLNGSGIGYFYPASTVDHNNFNYWNNLNTAYTVTSNDFVSLDSSQLLSSRQYDGSLPSITFLHLVSGSDLVNSGINVGILYNGSAPDLGPFETN